MRTLTDTLGSMHPRERMERRRRIHAIADWWTLKLRQKHAEEALYRCRCHQVATAKSGAMLRNYIWGQVARRLRD